MIYILLVEVGGGELEEIKKQEQKEAKEGFIPPILDQLSIIQ